MINTCKKFRNRRKGPDLWLRLLTVFGIVGWIAVIAEMIIADKARPPFETIATRVANMKLRSTWDMELAWYLFCLMCSGLFISLGGIIINSRRMNRKDDHVRINLIVLGVVSIFGIIMYLFFLE